MKNITIGIIISLMLNPIQVLSQDKDIYLKSAQSLFEKGEYDNAQKALNVYITVYYGIADELADKIETCISLTKRAEKAIVKQEIASAINSYKNILLINPNDPIAKGKIEELEELQIKEEAKETIASQSATIENNKNRQSATTTLQDLQKNGSDKQIGTLATKNKPYKLKKHRFTADLGLGYYWITDEDEDFTSNFDMLQISAKIRYLFSFNKNIGLEANITVTSDLSEMAGITASAGPRFSTNPTRKNRSFYIVPKIGYGYVSDFGVDAATYELELGYNLGKKNYLALSFLYLVSDVNYGLNYQFFRLNTISLSYGWYF